MRRKLQEQLLQWREAKKHEPLLLRGARQVGKTYLVEQLGQSAFDNFININFELTPEISSCFNSLDPKDIITSIGVMTRKEIIPGKTLLFLDEIQQHPRAIQSLRYFKERMPELHVIGAGSLLEFALNDEVYSMPVGRIQSLYVKPLSFREFLMASSFYGLVEFLQQVTLISIFPESMQIMLEKCLREYFTLGGMPEVIADYLEEGDLIRAQAKQTAIFSTYRNDFGKYASKVNHKYLQKIFERAPGMIGQHFQYSRIDAHMNSRQLRGALDNLVDADVIHRVYHTSASGLPLNSLINEKKFKTIFVDLGLAKSTFYLDPNLMLQDELLLLNQGALAEQFVGQELLTLVPPYLPGELYYWEREKSGSMAEVDYVMNVDENVIPIEVKAGKTGRLRSIQVFLEEKNATLGIQLSLNPLRYHNNILSIPLYMIHELPRLVREVLT